MKDKELKKILKKFDLLKAQTEKNEKLLEEVEKLLKDGEQ